MDLQEIREKLHEMYGGENKPILDGNYDPSLAVKCINGTFVGRKMDNITVFRGIPYVGQQPVGDLRWKAPVDVTPDDGVYEAISSPSTICFDRSKTKIRAGYSVSPIFCFMLVNYTHENFRRIGSLPPPIKKKLFLSIFLKSSIILSLNNISLCKTDNYVVIDAVIDV